MPCLCCNTQIIRGAAAVPGRARQPLDAAAPRQRSSEERERPETSQLVRDALEVELGPVLVDERLEVSHGLLKEAAQLRHQVRDVRLGQPSAIEADRRGVHLVRERLWIGDAAVFEHLPCRLHALNASCGWMIVVWGEQAAFS